MQQKHENKDRNNYIFGRLSTKGKKVFTYVRIGDPAKLPRGKGLGGYNCGKMGVNESVYTDTFEVD
ncbi:MAG: hypothetical protein ABI148_00530 [Ginsengibacter sp.]